MPDAYAPCPCGSGKKFKWCCQPFYGQIERAFEQQANGQHDAALQTMLKLTAEYPANAEVWGRYAELLWENEQREPADEAIGKALEVQPNYAFGFYLRAMMRHEERDIPAALELYRRAADACDPEASVLLAEIQASIGQCQQMLNRPLAAKAAFAVALRLQPGQTKLRTHVDEMFGPASILPPLARADYAFKPIAVAAPPERHKAWDDAIRANATGKLDDAARAFEHLASQDETDAAAWYNLGLARAWMGEHAGAIEAFHRFVELEADEVLAGEAWAIAEVLKLGRGMEDRSDYVERLAVLAITDMERAAEILQGERRLTDLQTTERGIGGLLLDRVMPAFHENLALYELPKVAAIFAIMGNRLILTNLDEGMLDKAVAILHESLGSLLQGPQFRNETPDFGRLAAHGIGLRIPEGVSQEQAKKFLLQYQDQVYLEEWPQQPRKSLGLNTPQEAVNHAVLRKKLIGVIRFLEDFRQHYFPGFFDFDRLRHKLGLPLRRPESRPAIREIASMNAAELAALPLDTLSDQDAALAFQAAVRVDAGDLAGQLARRLVASEESPIPDRYPFYHHLIQQATAGKDWTEALSLVDAGLKSDCEHNDGKRRTDYELRRAAIQLGAGEPDAAAATYAHLLERSPSSLDLYGRAAEAMLSAKRGTQAAAFAEQGAAQARKSGDRDRAAYFEELLAAAKR